jgi:uncharacterized protein (TIGR00369 family)
MRFLGLQVVRADKGQVEIRLPFREEFLRGDGSDWLHGGVVSSLADIVGDYAVVTETGQGVPTIDLRVDYLRAAEPGLDLFARADCIRVTRNVAFVRAIAYDRDPADPFASCMGAFMIGANRSGAPLTQLLQKASRS